MANTDLLLNIVDTDYAQADTVDWYCNKDW